MRADEIVYFLQEQMKFADVIGQQELCNTLERLVSEGRMPHAVLLTGIDGCGKLPVALALAHALLGGVDDGHLDKNSEHNAGLADRYVHPDLSFVYPVKKKAITTLSEMYAEEWRRQLEESSYFSFADWMEDMKCDREQPIIYEAESGEILKKMSMKSASGGRKVMIIAWADRMNDVCANKLLKLIEEPPAGTHLILITSDTSKILSTILSRTQIITVPPVKEDALKDFLIQRGVLAEKAAIVARQAKGSVTRAIQIQKGEGDELFFFDLFVMLMRRAYVRDVKEMQRWAFRMAEMPRERQKAFLEYAAGFVRENFMYNFHDPSLNYLSQSESDFSSKFARFVNERNVIPLMTEIDSAQRDIMQNVNSKMVFFDFALQMIVLLKQ